MSTFYHSFVSLLFIGIIALFPVVNPIGSAFMVSSYFEKLTNSEKRIAVRRITLYAFLICTVSLFAGHWILALFGISIPVIQVAGGTMICKMGWEMLSAKKKENEAGGGHIASPSGLAAIEDKLFYPITFPITTGAGTMSVLFTLSAHSASEDTTEYLINTSAIILSIIIMCVLVYIFYLNTKTIISFLGANGETIVNRISAFLIFCVGLQIATTGIKSLFMINH
ncbi:MAG: NAAT family transporter [Bacteroidetes bacterium]|nr:NAAT family transporter [Bacteroidota bacterium]